MIYRNLKELLNAYLDIMDKKHICDDIEMFSAGVNGDAEFLRIKGLMKIYNDAERNPPEGVIGVGAISYAEFVLQMVQK